MPGLLDNLTSKQAEKSNASKYKIAPYFSPPFDKF